VKGKRILVVDDEPELRHALRSTLCALGFVVALAETGEAALEILRAEKFDLVLLDINMPGLSGLEICRAIRARSDVGIVMLTVRDRAEDKIEALDAGATAMLPNRSTSMNCWLACGRPCDVGRLPPSAHRELFS
jgi:DNA-binding response OmpR family regulator